MQQYKNDLDLQAFPTSQIMKIFTMNWLTSSLKTKQQKTPKITEDVIIYLAINKIKY